MSEIDFDAIEGVKDLMKDSFPLIVSKFVEMSNEHVTTIEGSLLENDASSIVEAAHALKSSTGYLGLVRFREVVASLEMEAKKGNLSVLEEDVRRLRVLRDSSCEVLKAAV